MPTINLYGGPLKRVIITQAYGMCGQSAAEFELTPEEFDIALSFLNGIMFELRDTWGVDIGYNFPIYGNGQATEESGIPDRAMRPIARMLAEDIAPTIGATISSRISFEQAKATLVSQYAVRKQRALSTNTPRGSGNGRFAGWYDPFFNRADG